MIKFKLRILLVLSTLIVSCNNENPSKDIFNSTIEIMGDEYGNGYVTTGGQEGISHWTFKNGKLKLDYNAVVNMTGNVLESSEEYKLTNFRRVVRFDDDDSIEPTWEIEADWGGLPYWMVLKHFSKGEYNSYYDDSKRSHKDQWALIHNIRWNKNSWSQWQTYLTDNTTNELIKVFKIDKSSDEYKEFYNQHIDKIEKEKKEKKDYRISSFYDYYKDDLVERVSEVNPDNFFLIDELDNIRFKFNGETFTQTQFFQLMCRNVEKDLSKVSFDDYVSLHNEFNSNLRNKEKKIRLFEDILDRNPNYYVDTRNMFMFYKNNSGKLMFKIFHTRKNYNKDYYEFVDVRGRRGNFKKFQKYIRSRSPYESIVLNSFFNFLTKNIGNIEIDGVELKNKVLIFPSDDDIPINLENDKNLIKVQEWLTTNKENDN